MGWYVNKVSLERAPLRPPARGMAELLLANTMPQLHAGTISAVLELIENNVLLHTEYVHQADRIKALGRMVETADRRASGP